MSPYSHRRWLTTSEAAKLVGISTRTARLWCEQARWTCRSVGHGRWRVLASEALSEAAKRAAQADSETSCQLTGILVNPTDREYDALPGPQGEHQ